MNLLLSTFMYLKKKLSLNHKVIIHVIDKIEYNLLQLERRKINLQKKRESTKFGPQI